MVGLTTLSKQILLSSATLRCTLSLCTLIKSSNSWVARSIKFRRAGTCTLTGGVNHTGWWSNVEEAITEIASIQSKTKTPKQTKVTKTAIQSKNAGRMTTTTMTTSAKATTCTNERAGAMGWMTAVMAVGSDIEGLQTKLSVASYAGVVRLMGLKDR